MVRVIAKCVVGRGSIPGRHIPKTKKCSLMPLYLTFNIIRYGLRVSGAPQEKEQRLPLHISVIAIKKGDIESHYTTVDQLIYIYIYIR